MARVAMIVIDMLNPYRHQDAERLGGSVASIVKELGGLIARAHERDDVDLIYVNDNYGDFAATREDLVARALAGDRPDLVEPVLPPRDCPFLPKVRHSAFYGTSLEYLLRAQGVESVLLTGQVTEQCVLYSALDAYIRQFAIMVPPDCVAAIHPDLGRAALRMMERNMSARVVPAARCLPPAARSSAGRRR
ncbi:cysteine hydrolase [Nonomuraea sp. NN258]|uniref:cysteine hydrolase family protein n=1 Tax=Nonomuraea antri TaxID=2730852 RepID=UPI001569A01F|nr:isochorismatase family cysteine hydrolase [Nonomuraea antri]NRQ30445.1 cysteine hydrolase [Nonomuraea antri]